MREDVRLGEVTGRPEALVQLVEEAQIKVDAAVAGTVERPDGRLRVSARRLHRVTEQHRAGALVLTAEQLSPRLLGVFHDRVDEVDHLLFFRRGRDGAAGARCLNRGRRLVADERQKVDAGKPAQDEEDEDTANTHGHDADSPRPASLVVDVPAAARCPPHLFSSSTGSCKAAARICSHVEAGFSRPVDGPAKAGPYRTSTAIWRHCPWWNLATVRAQRAKCPARMAVQTVDDCSVPIDCAVKQILNGMST